jgi:hypothetical protein
VSNDLPIPDVLTKTLYAFLTSRLRLTSPPPCNPPRSGHPNEAHRWEMTFFYLWVQYSRWACHVARIAEKGKIPLGRPRRRWVDNIKMDVGEVGRGDVDWIGLAQDRNRWRADVNSVLNFRVP